MNALRQSLAPDDVRDALRKIGGLLLAVGFLIVFVRKSPGGVGDSWSDLALLVVLLLPCLFLYALGIHGYRNSGGLRPWESVYMVFGLIFVPLVLFQFVEFVNGDTGAAINWLWIFAVTSVIAGATFWFMGVRYQLLLASIAVIIAWSAFWDAVLSGGIEENVTVYRLMLLVIAAVLLLDASVLRGMLRNRSGEERAMGAAEEVTGAGLAAVLGAGFISLLPLNLGVEVLAPELASGLEPTALWNLVLLIVSIGLVGFGTMVALRGPAYVGALGLFTFIVIVGSGLGTDGEGGIGGWALATLIAGFVAVLLSLVPLIGSKPKPRRASSSRAKSGSRARSGSRAASGSRARRSR